jgi:hypothetical protein
MRRELLSGLGGFRLTFGALGDFELIMRAARRSASAHRDRVTAHSEPPGWSGRDLDTFPAWRAAARRADPPVVWRPVEAVWGPGHARWWSRVHPPT